jgi:hypothetical protein
LVDIVLEVYIINVADCSDAKKNWDIPFGAHPSV